MTAGEAARQLQVPESTLNSWMSSRQHPALIHAVQPERRGWPRLPFMAIVEAHVLRSLRVLGGRMDEIRLAAEVVRKELGDEYALVSRRIATDGVAVFVALADDSLLHVRGNQLTLRSVVADHLRLISWDDDGRPISLRLRQYPDTAAVVIDPRFGWGAPVLADSKVPVDAMLQLWRTGEPMAIVAKEFGVPATVAEDVLRAAA